MTIDKLTVEVKVTEDLRRYVKKIIRKANKIKWTHPRYGRRKCR